MSPPSQLLLGLCAALLLGDGADAFAATASGRRMAMPRDEFERACAAHRSITALKEDAPNTFLSAPADESIFCDDMVLRNDLGLQVVRGRSAYLEAFDVVRQASASSLVPLEVKEQVRCTFAAVAGGVDVRWRVPMRIGGAGGGANVELSGCSAYEVDARGRLRAHTLSDLRVNGRRLPSSALGAWLELLQARGPGSSPGSALLLLMDTLKAAEPDASPVSSAADGDTAGGAAAKATLDTNSEPPLPGSDAWAAYERRYRVLADLTSGFETLLEREPPLGAYAETVEVRAESGETLVEGKAQYVQLLRALRGVHSTLGASPLLRHTFDFDFVDASEVGLDTDDADADDAVGVAWEYTLRGAASGRTVGTLAATSVFVLRAAGDEATDEAPDKATGNTADDATSPLLRIERHVLVGLRLNGRPALPAPLLEQLRRVQADAPELVRLVSSTLLAVSAAGATGGGVGSATIGAAAEPLPSETAAATSAASSSAASSFATGYVRLLRALHAQLPRLRSEAPDVEGLCVSSVEVRGLLREPLLQGRPALAAAVSGLRQLATVIEREGALSFPAEGGAEWSLEVEESLAIAVRWSLSFELGGAERGRLAPRVALPGKLEGEIVLSLAADDARISELWLRQLAVNGREVVDGRLSELLKSLSEGRGGGDIVRELIRRAVSGSRWDPSSRD